MTILTPTHPRWGEFVNQLADLVREEGCVGDHSWGGGEYQFQHAIQVMTDMGGVDIDESLDFFEQRGADCDCFILINIAHISTERGVDE